MQHFARLLIRGLKLFGIVTLGSLIIAALVAFKQLLDTPQPLDSALPGEQRIFRWKHGHIFYTIVGSENTPPLVLIHAPGIGASGYEMRRIMPFLAQHYRVYTLDLLGFGLSDHPNIAYSAEIYTSLLSAFLADVVKQPATLFASGLSCLYAQAAAVREPQLCERLIFISPPTRQETSQARSRSLLLSPLFGSLLYALISSRPFLGYLLRHQDGSTKLLQSEEDLKYRYAAAHQLEAEHAPLALLAGKLQSSGPFPTNQPQPVLIMSAASTNPPHTANTSIRIISHVGTQIHLGEPEKVVEALLNWEKQLLAARQEVAIHKPGQQATIKTDEPTPTLSIKDGTRQPINNDTVPTYPQETIGTSHAEEQVAPPPEATSPRPQTPIEIPVDREPSASPLGNLEGQQQTSATFNGVEAYCLKCKKKSLMKDAHPVTLKNGRPALQGFCSVCDTKLTRMGKQPAQ